MIKSSPLIAIGIKINYLEHFHFVAFSDADNQRLIAIQSLTSLQQLASLLGSPC